MWFSALLMTALAAGCGGGGEGRDPILGTGVIDPVAAPTVTAVAPLANAVDVAVNTKIVTATFSKTMDPATLTTASFTLACVAPAGTAPVTVTGKAVTYLVAGNVATLTLPSVSDLPSDALCTATVTTGGKDTTGIALAKDFVWAFRTAADTTLPTVIAVNPIAPSSTACLKKIVNATFSKKMDPATINSPLFTFTIKTAGGTNVPGTVAYDVPTRVATFKAASDLLAGDYTATITTAAKDLAGNALAAAKIWNFSADGNTCTPTPPPAGAGPSILGLADTYAIASTAGVTNAAATTINGNVVLDPNATCNGESVLAAGTFGLCDGKAPTLNGVVVSPLFPDAGVTSGAVKADLRAAYIALSPAITVGATAMPAGTTLGNSVGSTLVQGDNYFVPGVYQSLTSILITGDVTLDAQGDPNAVFIFQSSSTIGTLGGADRILLVGGAKASNVWWWAGSAATLGTGTLWQGNILASDDVTMLVGASSCGRLFAGASTDGAFVLNNNVVSVPGNSSAPPTCQ